MRIKRYIAIPIFIACMATTIYSCKQEDVMPDLGVPDRGYTTEDKLKDSVYIYTYELYLWQDALPVRFNTTGYLSADDVLENLKGYAKNSRGEAYDRFSFLDRTGTISAEIQEGLAGSFGFDVRYENETDLYVKKVDPGSPAYRAGLRRGWQILSINGNTNLNQTTIEQDNFSFLFSALDASAIDLRLRKPDNEQVNVQLNRGSYRIEPVLADRVFSVSGKKIGYFAFDSFVSTETGMGSPTYIKNQLDALIGGFEQEGIEELILDLRYNGGGAVITADYLSNMLAPVSVNNSLMYTYKINELLEQTGWGAFFMPEYFKKMNNLNLARIYFLVTGSTASASELLINNLKPHMDVKLIGEYRTYGKPVGYFDWDIMGVDLYAVSFQMFNSEGHGDYFDGIAVDHLVYDDLIRDFGDPQESLLAEALYYAEHGSFRPAALQLQMGRGIGNLKGRQKEKLNRSLDQKGLKAMIDFRDTKNKKLSNQQ